MLNLACPIPLSWGHAFSAQRSLTWPCSRQGFFSVHTVTCPPHVQSWLHVQWAWIIPGLSIFIPLISMSNLITVAYYLLNYCTFMVSFGIKMYEPIRSLFSFSRIVLAIWVPSNFHRAFRTSINSIKPLGLHQICSWTWRVLYLNDIKCFNQWTQNFFQLVRSFFSFLIIFLNNVL
jgi:hypothetical protein